MISSWADIKHEQCGSGASKELWDAALNLFFCGDRDLIEYVQLVVGMAAIGKVYQEHMIIAYGSGANGKSTFWNTIFRVMGTYAGKLSAESLTMKCKRNIMPELAELKGRRLVISSEMQEGMRLNTSVVKQLCSTDEIQAEKKYKAPFHFVPSHTLVLYTNHARIMSQSMDFLEIGFEAAAEHDRDIVKLKEELLKCSTLKSSLYQDLKEGLINEKQFNRYREEYANREIALQKAVEEQERVIRRIFDGKIAAGIQLEEISNTLNISGLDRNALVTFIDRILVYEGGKIEIVTKYDAVIDKVERISDGISYGWKEAM